MRTHSTGFLVSGVAVILAVGLLVAAPSAQQRASQQDSSADVRTLIFELANSMGMLRGLQQEDSARSLEVWGAGSITTGGTRTEIPEYRMSLNYAVPGMRVDYTRKGGTGAQRSIEVVSGTAAWNETERGRNPSAAQNAVRQRLVQLWTTPFGVVKAARAASARASVKTAGGSTVLSFPLPAPVDDITVNATVRRDASLLVTPHKDQLPTLVGTYIVRVETVGSIVTDTTYAEYGEWNWADYRSDVMLPRRIVQKSGDTTLELTIKNTNTYNPYVVMPVPETLGGSR